MSLKFSKISFIIILAEGPGVAREKIDFLAYNTQKCPKKMSAQLVQPFGRLYATNIYMRMYCFII